MKIHYPSISRFQQFVELKDFRPPSKKEYVRYVRKLAEHFQCDPLTLSENQLREYFLFLRQHKQYKRSPMNVPKPTPSPPPLCRHCQRPMLWVRRQARAPP